MKKSWYHKPKKVNRPKIDKRAVYKKIENKSCIYITFPLDRDEVVHIKSLQGYQQHPGKPIYWTCPINPKNIMLLKEWGFRFDRKLNDLYRKVGRKTKIQSIPGLLGELYSFQLEGVQFIEEHKGRTILADEMGLGKTIQALAWLQLHPERRPAVIIVPASLKLNWAREAGKWIKDPKVQIFEGRYQGQSIDGEIIIINYDILANKYEPTKGKKKGKEIPKSGWVDHLIAIKPQVLILDESHYIKNSNARRSRSVKKIGKKVPYILGLSGTPIVNRPIEIYNVFNLISQSDVPDFWTFAQHFCAAKQTRFGWDFSGASNTEELNELLINTVMLRRKKDEVLKELPDKVRAMVPIEINNRDEYSIMEFDFIKWVREHYGSAAAKKAKNAKALTELSALKQLAAKGKLAFAINWIKNFLESDQKLIVFCTHKFVIDELMDNFKQAVKIDGSVSTKIRQEVVDAFQNDKNVRLFIGNIQAAGVGLTLTSASNVAFLEFPWTPGEMSQAEDRSHRIGQESSVTIYYLFAENTIEERIVKALDKKRKTLDMVLDGLETSSESLITSLITDYVEGD
jgi:SWI/SNF-related matrix-associated actin-dependent regulator of chromatin subfamily A-like protein 1